MILNEIVFGILVAEMVALLLLVAPMPYTVHRALISFVARGNVFGRLIYTFRIVFGIVFLMFCDSINRMLKTKKEYDIEKIGQVDHNHHHMTEGADCYIRSRMFYAQRNVYLTGFCLFLSLILHRFFTILVKLYQSQGPPPTKTTVAAFPSGNVAPTTAKAAASKEPGTAVAKDSGNKAQTELDIVKRQAAQNRQEYMRLADRYNDLELKYNSVLATQSAEPSAGFPASAVSSARDTAQEQGLSRKTK